ncbi:hypothetical protein AAKU58_000734 [Oxalobacteraceae bacterium GrIS 1.18]
MTNNFDLALADLGFPSFGDDDFFNFSLERGDKTHISVSLHRDQESNLLRISACTSNGISHGVSQQFFEQFAQAAMEPFRDGFGVGMLENSDRLCVFYSLPIQDYVVGKSSAILEKLIEQVEKWDALLPYAGH